MTDAPELSERTRAEQELGRKLAAQNALKFEQAVKAREAEKAPPPDEAQAAVDEALQQRSDKSKPHKGDRK